MSNPLDTKIISRLAEILDKTNLTELEYEDEGCRISLVRNPAGVAVAGAYAPVQAPNGRRGLPVGRPEISKLCQARRYGCRGRYGLPGRSDENL